MKQPALREFPVSAESLPVDLDHPNRSLIHGFFRETTKSAASSRTFYTYIPAGLENDQPCFVVAAPSGSEPLDFLESTGLRALADRRQIFVHLLVPAATGWKTDGTDADYMNDVYKAIQQRDWYVTMQDNIYACGVGDGAIVAHQAVQRMASEWSGLVSFGELQHHLNETRYATAQQTEQGLTELRITAAKCPVPIWMMVKELSPSVESALTYWKEENHVDPTPLSGDGADAIWMPPAVRSRSEVNEEQLAQVRLTLGTETMTQEALEKTWSFLTLARRHRGFDGKNLRSYKDPLKSGAVLQERKIDGMTRLWYEYVPETCTPDQKWPLVVVMHGRGGTAASFFDLTDMHLVAEARRFIVVYPQAGIHQQKPGGLKNVLYWNGSYEGKSIDDVGFIREMIRDMKERLPIDPGRIYACGQSSGGIMADVLSTSASDLFTACASWSGMYHPRKVHSHYEKTTPVIPTMFICGEHDPFCTEPGEDPDLPFRLIPELKADIMEKMARCGLDPKRMQTWKTDPITWYCYPDTQGVPMLTVGIVRDMAHANFPEESWISWDALFSQFRRGKDGQLYYRA
ncbi:MAG: hypothetical protein IKP22_06690 [Clostridia bacterium]|nr:hypothetical protein [Clostridia bacterium]MBR6861603.1 hypothetical protein [Acidaminococcaceae bacterium]MBR7174686.1 hypothetical protein [Clostridia bacterium]